MKTRRLLQEGRKFNEKIYIIIYLSQSTLKLFPKVGQEQKTNKKKEKKMLINFKKKFKDACSNPFINNFL